MLAAAVQGAQTGGGHDGRLVGSPPQTGALHEPKLHGFFRGRGGCQLSETTGPAVREGGVQLKYELSFCWLHSLWVVLVYLSHVLFDSVDGFPFYGVAYTVMLFSSLPAHSWIIWAMLHSH